MTNTEQKKRMYWLGTYPDRDWPRVFSIFIVVLIAAVFMGVYMYFSYMNNVQVVQQSRVVNGNGTTSTDTIFEIYNKKAEDFERVKGEIEGLVVVPDPSL